MFSISGDDKKQMMEFMDWLNQMPSPSTYDYYTRKINRIIYLDTEISEDADTIDVVKQLISWNIEDRDIPKEERKPILLMIYSYGGDAELCRSIIDAISSSITPVWGVNLGVCMSAAAYIYISCHKKFMFKRSYFLFHQGSAGFEGDYEKIKQHFAEYEKSVSQLSSIMEEFTNYSKEDIEKCIVNEWYVYADEAVANGVCDKVIESLDEIIANK